MKKKGLDQSPRPPVSSARSQTHVDSGRRDVLLGLAGLAAVLAGCGGGGGATSHDSTRRNVLMIVVDDLNDWVGFLGGHPQVQTPNMDRLAARSTVFTRAYCNIPLCNASRASAWSGLSVQDTKVFDNFTGLKTANPSAVVLPAYLAANGYKSQLFGKIHHIRSGGPYADPVPRDAPVTNKQCSPPSGPGAFDWASLEVDESATSDYQIAEQAKAFLGTSHDQPFFLAAGFLRPHTAWYVPQAYFDLYPENSVVVPTVPPDDLDDLPPAAREIALEFNFHDCITSQGLWASAVRGYLASVSFVDAQIGRLLDALEQSEYADNTIVVLWGDHGFHLGEKFHWHKQALWERATRIPFVIRQPGQTAGSRVDAPVSLIDLVPTTLDLCGGIEAPYPLAGHSLRPLLDDPTALWDYPVLTTKDQYNYAIRTAEWRYIRYSNGDRELYDEVADPNEWTNLAEDPSKQSIIAQLDALMPPLP